MKIGTYTTFGKLCNKKNYQLREKFSKILEKSLQEI